MARNESKLVNLAAYAALRTLGTAMQAFDVDEAMSTIGAIGDFWYRTDHRRRRRALDHIRRSLPQLDAEQAADLCRRSMRHLFQTFAVEVIYTPRLITPATWPNYVRFGEVSEPLRILTGGGPAIFICGHAGNFELLGFTLATVGFPLYALARPLDLPRIDRWILEVRQQRGMTILTKFGAMEEVPRLLERGERVAFIADQNAGDGGLFVPFFGRLASAYKSIGLLAMRYETPVICGMARRVQEDRFQYAIEMTDLIRPADWENQPDPLYYLTARYTRAIETMVRAAPEQYFWVHRRWKSRPRHEREGCPMPEPLRRRLADLPWMTDEELERIVEMSEREAAVHPQSS